MTQTKAELLQTRHQGDIRLGDADSSHYVGFKAPATVSSSLVWTLPAADGSASQILKTDGSGNLGWATPIFTIPFWTAACEAFVLSLVGQYNTPLTCAIFNGNTKIVKLLLLHDADKTYRATSGMSPLNAACFHGHSEIGAILINKSPGLVDQRHHIGKKPDRCCTPMANAARCCNKPLHWKRSDTIGLSLYCGLIGLPIFIALIIFFSMVGESL